MSAFVQHRSGVLRRHLLVAAAGAVAMPSEGRADVHESAGRVVPRRPAPPLRLRDHAGRQVQLEQLLTGKQTALQLMFTGCSSVCPLQGALFSALQPAIEGLTFENQLLSISIDPLADSPVELDKWRAKFSAGPRWRAAVTAHGDLAQLLSWLNGAASDSIDRHTTQIFLIDASAQLSWRSTELPSVGEVLSGLRALGKTT